MSADPPPCLPRIVPVRAIPPREAEVLRPKLGDAVLYRGVRCRVTAVLPEGASYVPAGKIMPVDLISEGASLGASPLHGSMVGYGPNSGWSWPDVALPEGGPRDDA